MTNNVIWLPKAGTAAQNNPFTGVNREITIDTENWQIRIHDGVTAGGQHLGYAKLNTANTYVGLQNFGDGIDTSSAIIDNVYIVGNTLSTLNANGDFIVDPNGTGSIKTTKNTYLATSSGNVGINTQSVTELTTHTTTLQITGRHNDYTGGIRLRSLDNSVDTAIYATASGGLHVASITDDIVVIDVNNSPIIQFETGAARFQQTGAILWMAPSAGNAGIYTSGTDFKIFNGAGAEDRITVSNVGNVGIGALSPKTLLEVAASNGNAGTPTAGTLARFASTGGAGNASYIEIIGGTSGGAGVLLGDSDNGDQGTIYYSNSNDSLQIGANGNYGQLTLHGNGNFHVGGTSDPGAKLGVTGNILTTGDIYLTTPASGSMGLSYDGSIADLAVNSSSAVLTLSTNSTERLRIDSVGDIAFGTSTTASIGGGYRTMVLDGTNGSGFIFKVNGTNTGIVYAATTSLRIDAVGVSTHIAFNTNAGESVRITPTGRMGIGNTDPQHKLDVSDSSIRVRSSKTPATSSSSGNAGEICWDSNYVYVCVGTNSWKRAAISTW